MVTVESHSVDSKLGRRKRGFTEQASGSDKFEEYLHVMQPPSKSKIWSNEDLERQSDVAHSTLDTLQLNTFGDRNNENYETIPKRFKSALRPHQDGEVLNHSEENPTTATSNLPPSDVIPEAPSILDQELPNTTDGDWLRSRTKNVVAVDHTDDAMSLNASLETDVLDQESITDHQVSKRIVPDSNIQAEAATDSQSSTPAVSAEHATARIFVRNLAYATTEDDLREYFTSHGSDSVQAVCSVMSLIDFQILNIWPIL